MTSKKLGLLAMLIAATVIWAIPSASVGKPLALQKAGSALRDMTTQVGDAVDQTVAKTDDAVRKAKDKAAAALAKAKAQAKAKGKTGTRATATDPATQPPLHGTDPHAQGAVAVVDTAPSSQRPLPSDPTGKTTGEDAIVGSARGEQVNGAYHGHITIVSLLGSELAGVDTNPGETKNGPLQGVQTSILDPLCTSTSQQVCLSVLTANSTTTATGSDNDFAIARASVLGLGVGAAESHGTIGEDANCQAASGSSKTANVTSPGGGAVASVANSNSTSKSCRGAAPVVTNTSSVIGLGGTQVPLPAAGCANGTPDTVSGIPAVLPIVCNADDIAGAAAVREALDVFVLQVGGTSLAKETTAASESDSAAPAAPKETGAQCADGIDNDGDGLIDKADPGCHSDNNAKNDDSYNPKDNDETDKKAGTGGSGNETGTQCNDKKDNDGDGLIDAKDPGCHVDNDLSKPYDANDNSEGSDNGNGNGNGNGGGGGNAPTGGQSTSSGTLPFTGTDVVGLGLAGLLMLAGGLLLRRREDAHTAL
jgi:LPXTG-motif cell wall-anchored protein